MLHMNRLILAVIMFE